MNPKTKAILDQVKILAQTYPDFVYAANHSHYSPCQYNAGGDPEHPELCGCIIGQAARKVGIDTSDWDAIPNETSYLDTGIKSRIEDRLRENPYLPEADILSCIQHLQDIGTPWGKAYAEAMDGYPQTPEDAPRKTFTHDGTTYEIPDGRDIGKLAWVSARGEASACSNQVCIRITDYRPDNERPYVPEFGGDWEYAVLIPKEYGNGNG